MSNGGFGGIHQKLLRALAIGRRDVPRSASCRPATRRSSSSSRSGSIRSSTRARSRWPTRVQAAHLAGVRDVVPTYRSVAVYFDPLRTDSDALMACVEREAIRAGGAAGRRRGAGAHSGLLRRRARPRPRGRSPRSRRLGEDEVVRLHAAATYRVFMLGFVPGFAYLGIVDDADRDAAPRRRRACACPPGSVGIAGVQTGIYPAETPGGWQLIGRTPLKPFDPSRAKPFLMKAGDAVQFYRDRSREYDAWLQCSGRDRHAPGCRPRDQAGHADDGAGPRALGISVARRAGRRADGSVCRTGSPTRSSATTATRRRSRSRCSARSSSSRTSALVAVAGAEFELTLDGRPVPSQRAVHRLGRLAAALRRAAAGRARLPRGRRRHRRAAGARQPIDAPGQRDGRRRRAVRCVAGDRLPLGDPRRVARDARWRRRRPPIALPDRHARIRVLPGPQRELLRRRCARRAAVGAVHDRPELRSHGIPARRAARSTHARGADIISDATPLGALQVPASGQPILLMADRQTTGGYPKIATVITRRHRRLPGSWRPGDTISFAVCTPARGAGGADRAGARADGGRGAAPVTDFVAALRRRRSAPIACARTSPLAPLTTFRVGGPADWLLETRNERRDRDGACDSRARRACR